MSEGGERASAPASANSSSAGDDARDPSVSYRYWVGQRGNGSEAAAPAAQPRKLSKEEAASLSSMSRSGSQGSLWNQGGTWEERTLNDWAKAKLTELLLAAQEVRVLGAQYQVTTELDSLSGDTTIVVVRNKKKPGYMLDISVKFKGRGEADSSKLLEGSLRIPEATFGDVDGTHLEVTLDAGKSGISESARGSAELELTKQLLPLIQDRLQIFESELSQR